MGIQFGPRLPQATSTIVAVDPLIVSSSTQTQSFSLNFTNGGVTGSNGPIQANISTAGVTVNNGYQSYTIPTTGTYTFTVNGASGGVYTAAPPTTVNAPTIAGFKRAPGAKVTGQYFLTAGQVITIVVGQGGGDDTLYNNPGGGGGSFVTLGTYANIIAGTDTLLFAAGGGGGSGIGGGGVDNYTAGIGQSTTSGGSTSDAVGGTAGNGAVAINTQTNSTSGGGYLTGAGLSTSSNFGGTPQDGYTSGFRQGAVGSRNSGTAVGFGGFGGGGSGSSQLSTDNDKGGGGGYSGGGYAFDSSIYAGGGGSYADPSATNVVITAGGNGQDRHGSVVVTGNQTVIPPKILTNIVSTLNTTSAVDSSVVQGQVEYTTPGTYSWTCPPNVTRVNVVCVGGGGGGGYGGANGGSGAGGNLRYSNNIPVVPNQTYQVNVGAGGLAGTAVTLNGTSGSSSSFSNLVIAQGGSGGTTVGGTFAPSGNIGLGSNGGNGAASDGGGGGAGGYVSLTIPPAGVITVGTNQYDATSLGPVVSVDTIGSHSSASSMASSGFLKYLLTTSSGSREVNVSYRKTGTTISQSAFTTESGIFQYTGNTSSLLFYANDDHDSMFVDADGRGCIARSNVNTINSTSWDKFQGSAEIITNSSIDSVAVYPINSVLGANSTIITFPATRSSITINLTSLLYKVNNGSNTSLPSPVSGLGTAAPTNSIWHISDGVNQFIIGRYASTTAYICTVNLETNTLTASSLSITAPTQTNTTEEDAIGTQLFAVDGVATWCSNTVHYYGGTLDWKTNTNPFNIAGKLSITAGSGNTQTDMDIWGSIDSAGYVWFADWGHDDGGLFGIGNDDRLNTRPTNIKYVTSISPAEQIGQGGGNGGSLSGTSPGAGIGGAGGGGGGGTGGAGGGGVGIYGYTSDGSMGVTKAALTNGIQQGGGGSGGTGGLVKNSGTDLTAQTGGLYGGGGGAGSNGGPGGGGAVRIIWGAGRSFPYAASNVTETSGTTNSTNKLEPVLSLNSTISTSSYLEFQGASTSYATISNVSNSNYITINAAIYLANWTTATGTFINNVDSSGAVKFQIGINQGSFTGSLYALFRLRTFGNYGVGFSRASITAGWHIITAVYNGSQALLYIDGVLANSATPLTSTLELGVGTVSLGARISGASVVESISCRTGVFNILEQAYSATDAADYFNSYRGRYGI